MRNKMFHTTCCFSFIFSWKIGYSNIDYFPQTAHPQVIYSQLNFSSHHSLTQKSANNSPRNLHSTHSKSVFSFLFKSEMYFKRRSWAMKVFTPWSTHKARKNTHSGIIRTRVLESVPLSSGWNPQCNTCMLPGGDCRWAIALKLY